MPRPLLDYTVAPHPTLKVELILKPNAEQASDLAQRLQPLMNGGEIAVSLDHKDAPAPGLPGGMWKTYFKVRDTDTRLLLAHPAPEEWVAVFALEGAVMEALILALRSGKPCKLSELARLNTVSNMHLAFEVI